MLALRRLAPAAIGLAVLASCATSSESAAADTMTANVGIYPPPPAGLPMVRVGVPKFEVASGITGEVSTLAADQLSTLATQSRRFLVVERAQLDKLLEEQKLAGVVRDAELAAKQNVRGAQYLWIGKVTNMRVKQEKSGKGFGLGAIPIPGARALRGFDYKDKSSTIKVECGVDLRLVEASTGTVAVADFAEYTRTDSVGAFGISILGVGTSAEADLKIDSNNRGKILRLALDHAMRKMLPSIDQYLEKQHAASK